MDKFIRILEFSEQLFRDQKIAWQASEVIQGIMEAGSLRLIDIAAKMVGNETE